MARRRCLCHLLSKLLHRLATRLFLAIGYWAGSFYTRSRAIQREV